MIPYRDHPHLYEINTWNWLTTLSRTAGREITLGNVPESEWDALGDRGFDFLWLMGIWERSPEARRIGQLSPELRREYAHALPSWRSEDVVGSPYAIHAYRPDPRLATWEELDRTRKRLRERGIGLILDFVPNHTALDHPWVKERPELYIGTRTQPGGAGRASFFAVQGNAGNRRYLAHGKDPYFPAWSDTAQLDHFNPATRRALLAELQSISEHCDGIRCDMAMLVLNQIFERTWEGFLEHSRPTTEFWDDAIAAMPDLVWIAEAYWDRERELQDIGFSFTYDKPLYDLLRDGDAGQVRRHLARDIAYQCRLVRFLENHDERRSARVFGLERFPAVGVLSTTLPGMRFYHRGQLEGRKIHLPVQLSRAQAEDPDPYFLEFYDKVLHWTNEPVFHEGAWTLLPVKSVGDDSQRNLIVYQWHTPESWRLLAANLSSSTARGSVRLERSSFDHVGEHDSLLFLDHLTERTYRRNTEELARSGLYIELDAFNAHFFSVQRAGPERKP